MGLTRAEQETVIRWDEEEQVVRLYSAAPRTWRRCSKLGVAVVKEATLAETGEVSGRFYRIPFEQFRWGLKVKTTSTGNAASLQKARATKTVAP